MVVTIVLVGSVLLSLGFSYLGYKDEIVEFNKQEEIRQNSKPESEGFNFTPEDFDMNPTRDIDDKFKTKLYLHLGAIGFIILSELGLLIVLPRKKKDLNV